MQILRKPWFWLSCVVAISAQAVYAQPPSPARSAPVKVGHVPVATILQRLGAKLERGSEAGELESYASHFDRMDTNRDGKHTRVEYVDKGGYMTPQARAGIFRAADGNADGVVTKAEYVLNRVITDEAKAIVQGMDDDEDGLVERAEFVKHAAKLLSDRELAEQVFAALDANADGGIPIPEYLRVWGQWARAGRPGPGAGPPGVDEIFERFDRNKDGKLQKDEVPEFAQRFILRADADGNDVVTREELELSRQRQRPGGRPAGDWPQFHGPHRNNISTDKGLLKTWPEGGPSRLWEAAGIGEGFSTVSIVGKRIYTAGAVNADCVITALDMDGKEVWTRKNGKAWNRSYPGTRSTPTIAEGLLYHLSGIGNLMCLKADSGEVVWTVDILERFSGRNIRWGLAESPLVVDDRVICTPGGAKVSMVALDRKTGEVLWQCAGAGDKPGYASPILVEYQGLKQIVTPMSESIVGVRASDGKLLWRYPHKVYTDQNITTPLFHDGFLIVSGCVGKGTTSLQLRVSGDACSVEQHWHNETLDNKQGGIVLLDGRLYGYAPSQNRSRPWVCVDFKSGGTIFQSAAVKSSYKYKNGCITCADGMLYLFSDNGNMALAKPMDTGLEVAGRLRIEEPGKRPTWAHPVVHGGRLYLRYGDRLGVYNVSAGVARKQK